MRIAWLSLLTLCFVLNGCCENEHPAQRLSPDGKWKYVTFQRTCGATTSANFQVSILSASKSAPNEPGNTFIAVVDGTLPVEWVSSRELKIYYPARLRVTKKESAVGPIHITYVVAQ